MPSFSHSQLETFEQCKRKYKFKYVDRVPVKIPTTIELFLGNVVHKVLEKLYASLPNALTSVQVIALYESVWQTTWKADILVVKGTVDFYKQRGKEFLQNYYDSHTPFTQYAIVGLETNNTYVLPSQDTYSIRIDKLLKDSSNTFYVCDYKTANSLKSAAELENSRQLIMYALWVQKTYGAKMVKLVWHFLAHTTDVIVETTPETQLRMQAQVLEVIEHIKQEKVYDTNVSRLCDWCVYKSMCPAFSGQQPLSRFL